MHILQVDIFVSFLLGVPVDEEVFFVSPPPNDYFFDLRVTFSDPLNNGRCIGDGWRWEKIHISGTQIIFVVGMWRGETVVYSDPVVGDQQWVVGHGVKTSINENMINVEHIDSTNTGILLYSDQYLISVLDLFREVVQMFSYKHSLPARKLPLLFCI